MQEQASLLDNQNKGAVVSRYASVSAGQPADAAATLSAVLSQQDPKKYQISVGDFVFEFRSPTPRRPPGLLLVAYSKHQAQSTVAGHLSPCPRDVRSHRYAPGGLLLGARADKTERGKGEKGENMSSAFSGNMISCAQYFDRPDPTHHREP